MHTHNQQQYLAKEIFTIHPHLSNWLKQYFAHFEESSLLATIASCENKSCPLTNTLLKFRAAGQWLELKIARALPQISRLDFLLAAAKQFPPKQKTSK